jgi:hypothetical protein
MAFKLSVVSGMGRFTANRAYPNGPEAKKRSSQHSRTPLSRQPQNGCLFFSLWHSVQAVAAGFAISMVL